MKRFVVAVLVVAAPAAASETDPYYAWLRPVSDSAQALDERAARVYRIELEKVNADPIHGTFPCLKVARAITRPMIKAGSWPLIGTKTGWALDFTPANATEFEDEYPQRGIYRYTWLLPFGIIAPVKPSIRLRHVTVGVDKVAHFFSEGWRYYRTYQAARANGATIEEAERAAIDRGIRQERKWYGMHTSGIFSYADLEANWQGFQHVRDLCEGPNARLVIEDHKWVLKAPFSIDEYINPCWDEAWNPNGFARRHHRRVRRALEETCPLFSRGDVQDTWAQYEREGCHSTSQTLAMKLVNEGVLPDPRPLRIDAVCAAR